jgi:type IV secretory pathway VirB10-like protein
MRSARPPVVSGVYPNKIVFPDGSTVDLDKMPATDSGGYSGLQDHVDSHEFQLLKGVALASLLGVGSQLSFGNGNGLARAIREAVQQNGARAGDQIVSKNLDVQPTLRVRPGWPVLAILRENLVLKPWKAWMP